MINLIKVFSITLCLLTSSFCVVFAESLEDRKSAFDRNDFADALRIFGKLADHGSAGALFWLGYMHHTGSGVPQDDAEALRLFKQARESKEFYIDPSRVGP